MEPDKKDRPGRGGPSKKTIAHSNSPKNTINRARYQPSDSLHGPPAGFDAVSNPIIGKHYFGLPSLDEAHAQGLGLTVFEARRTNTTAFASVQPREQRR